jgi:hypothetical protein
MVHQTGVMEEANGCRLESSLLVKHHEYIIEEGRTNRECRNEDLCSPSERVERRYAQVRRRRWE